MAHSANIISKVKLPGSDIEYEIHDAQAVHSAADLGLSAALVFKGTKATKAQLPSTGNKSGDVWHVTEDDYEYVWNGSAWEELGAPHDFVGTDDFNTHVEKYNDHIHSSVTVTGTNVASAVTGKVAVPTITTNPKYIKVSVEQPTPDSRNVLGENTDFTVSITPEFLDLEANRSKDVTVNGDTTQIVKAYGPPATVKAITELNTTTIKNPSVSSVSIPNVTNNASVETSLVELNTSDNLISEITSNESVYSSNITDGGTLPTWTASVSNGILSFSFNAGKMPAYESVESTNTKYVDNNIGDYVTVTPKTASKVTLGLALSASHVTTTNTTVATGAKTSKDVMTALGTPTYADVLTAVQVTQQPDFTLAFADEESTGDVTVMTSILDTSVRAGKDDLVTALTSVAAPTVELYATPTASEGVLTGHTVTVGTADVDLRNGSAAAQVWTQKSGFTGTPSNPVG